MTPPTAPSSLPVGPGPSLPTADPLSHEVFTIHLHSSAYGARQQRETEQAINAAVQVLRRQFGLKDAPAYALLVQASKDSRLSLENTALGLLQ